MIKASAALLGGSLTWRQCNKYLKPSADQQNLLLVRDTSYNFDDLFNVEGQSKADVAMK